MPRSYELRQRGVAAARRLRLRAALHAQSISNRQLIRAERANVGKRAGFATLPRLPQYRTLAGVGDFAYDLAANVDVIREADGTTWGSQVRHSAVSPNEGVVLARGRLALSGDLTDRVDEGRATKCTAKGPKVFHRAVVPEDGMGLTRSSVGGSHYLAQDIDVCREAGT